VKKSVYLFNHLRAANSYSLKTTYYHKNTLSFRDDVTAFKKYNCLKVAEIQLIELLFNNLPNISYLFID